MLALSTALRPPQNQDPTAIVRLAADTGFEGIFAAEGTSLSLLPTLVSASARAGLRLIGVRAPMPAGWLGSGKRMPHLVALDDRDERQAALASVRHTLELGRDLGVTHLWLEPGPAPLSSPLPEFQRRFARAEMDEDEPGDKRLASALEERKAFATTIGDVLRASLERVLREAERHSVTIALPFAATPWGTPSPREALELVREFSGAPLTIAFSCASWAVALRLGLGGPVERATELARASAVLIASDAVGLETDLLPGLGEDTPMPPIKAAITIVTGRGDSRRSEVTRACERLAAARRAATSAA